MPNKPFHSAPRFALAATLLAGLAACANYSGITPQSSLREAPSLGLNANGPAVAAIDAEWWHGFQDPQLDRLVTQALEGSPNLKLAQARLRRAQAVADATHAADLPRVDADIEGQRQRYTENGLYPAPLAGGNYNSGTAQLTSSWELDFFGKNRAALDAALGQTKAAQADTQAARVLLVSQVARSYFQLLRLNGQLELANRTLAQRSELLRLVQDRVQAGLDTRLELKQSEGSLPEARQQVEALNEQIALARNALSALVGQPNVADALVLPALAAIKTAANAQAIPADLLGRRADIAAARWRIEAAGKDVASAKAQFYPNINLVGFAGFSSIGLGNLLQSSSQQWGIGPAIHLPIFDAGRLRAGLSGKTADLDAAVESYNAALLDAVRDVADQLASQQSIGLQQAQQKAAQDAAEAAYEIAVQRYGAGLGNYLNVLGAETAVLAQRRLQVDLAARALDTQVALIRALGGGYTANATESVAARADRESGEARFYALSGIATQ
ncbi:efflux transporter outer membrane subunit [Rhodoferax sp.]|uniref:efflux transporter outer membrane subunit n=1 Tax=Rhodoferax sp. TaxID=50421 RepID=UPI00374DB0AB